MITELCDDQIAPGLISPAWEDYCFANIPDTILSVFGNEATRPLPEGVFEGVSTDIDHVVVVFVDGFGWNHFQRVRDDHSFLTRIVKYATVTPLTSSYPSGTTAAVSTMHTGRQPVEHGILGWDTYVESLGGLVQALIFADREGKPLEDVRENPDPAELIDERTLYERLDAESVLIQPDGIGENPYDTQTTRGAKIVNYDNAAQATYRVRNQLEQATKPVYCYCYLPKVDMLSHAVGVGHEETDAQLGSISHAIERELVEKLDPDIAKRTLLLLISDHGEIDTVPEKRIDIRTLDVDDHLQRDKNGDLIPVLGGPRNLQFHAKVGHCDALRSKLESELAALDPIIFDREEIIDKQLFGDRKPGDRFRQRCPDLLVVPREGFAKDDETVSETVGMHTGLHPDEMLVPFAAARIDTLQT